MPWAAAIPAIIGGASSILGSALSGRSQTSSTAPVLSPAMLALQKQLLGYSTDLMNGTGPEALGGLNTINQAYAQMPDKITAQLAGRGFGASGKLGTALYDTENARLNNQSSFRAQSAQTGAGLADRLLAGGTGTSTIGPSSALANGFLSAGNGLSNLSTLLMLQKTLSKRGGGGDTYYLSPAGGYGLGYPEQGVQSSSLPTSGSSGDFGGEYGGGGYVPPANGGDWGGYG